MPLLPSLLLIVFAVQVQKWLNECTHVPTENVHSRGSPAPVIRLRQSVGRQPSDNILAIFRQGVKNQVFLCVQRWA